MRIKTALVVAGILSTTQTASPQAAQQPSRTEQQSPAVQMTVPQAQQPQQQQRPERQRPAEQPSRGSEQRREPPAEEKTSVTHHSARIGGQQIGYTATAATYVIRADDGSPKATMFYVAYTKEGVDSFKRADLLRLQRRPRLSVTLHSHGHGAQASRSD